MLQKRIDQLSVKTSTMKEQFHELESKISEKFKSAMEKLTDLKKENLGKLESMLEGLEMRMRELKWMEYFNKFQIDYIEPEKYMRKYFVHQQTQKSFYEQLGLGKKTFVTDKHSDFIIKGHIDIVSNNSREIAQNQKRKVVDELHAQKMKEERLNKLNKIRKEELKKEEKIEQEQLFSKLVEKTGQIKKNNLSGRGGRRAAVEIILDSEDDLDGASTFRSKIVDTLPDENKPKMDNGSVSETYTESDFEGQQSDPMLSSRSTMNKVMKSSDRADSREDSPQNLGFSSERKRNRRKFKEKKKMLEKEVYKPPHNNIPLLNIQKTQEMLKKKQKKVVFHADVKNPEPYKKEQPDNYIEPEAINFEEDLSTPRDIVRSSCESVASNAPSSYRHISRLSESGKMVIVDLVRLFGEENVNLSLEEAFEDSEILNDSEGTYTYLNCVKYFAKKVALYRKQEEMSVSMK